MKNAVVLCKSEILCALGFLEESVSSILSGKSGIINGPFFSIPVACAPFLSYIKKDLKSIVHLFKSRIDLSAYDQSNLLFIYCAAKGDISSFDNNSAPASIVPLSVQAQLISSWLQIRPSRIITVSNACASGAAAIETAKEYLEMEKFTCAIIFGFDTISSFILSGFHALNAVSQHGARPFDEKRDGLTLGDGAAIVILTTKVAEVGDIIVKGTASSNDANHRTGPSRTGDGLFRAANAALKDAGIFESLIAAVKCHGTATPYNDAMEAKALTRLFTAVPACFSLKGAIGHTSGAGSLIEIILASEFIKRKMIPPTAGYDKHGVEEPIPVTKTLQSLQGNTILCLSAGFGGLNSAVVLTEHT